MKILKGLFLVLGVAVLAVGGYYLANVFLYMQTVMGAANTGRSANVLASPVPRIMLIAAFAAVGGLLLGLGLALPSRTRSAVRRQALQDASDAREAAIRQRIGGQGHDTELDGGSETREIQGPSGSTRAEEQR